MGIVIGIMFLGRMPHNRLFKHMANTGPPLHAGALPYC